MDKAEGTKVRCSMSARVLVCGFFSIGFKSRALGIPDEITVTTLCRWGSSNITCISPDKIKLNQFNFSLEVFKQDLHTAQSDRFGDHQATSKLPFSLRTYGLRRAPPLKALGE